MRDLKNQLNLILIMALLQLYYYNNSNSANAIHHKKISSTNP